MLANGYEIESKSYASWPCESTAERNGKVEKGTEKEEWMVLTNTLTL